ncbi:restriction endonuclease [Arthrobacter sp. SDTb3-6]|uniref:restriction endonuclease n=1 Tax=Arthrobacter sp. SDTb3-6 TaxID=2713571 RepID=UPI00159E3605|nr:restriction endonuclease [Arthrobacter sp. SDTb3-6]
MTIPKWYEFILPALQVLEDGQDHTLRSIRSGVLGRVDLTPEERVEQIPSGQERWYNRLLWALTHSYNAGLVSRPSRGIYRVSDEGQVLAAKGLPVTAAMLREYPSYLEFMNRSGRSAEASGPSVPTDEDAAAETPTDALDAALAALNRSLVAEVYSYLAHLSPDAFERLIRIFVVQLGYGANRTNEATARLTAADKGIDGIVWQDALGLDRVYLQAKRYGVENKVGGREVRGFSGALDQHRATKGIFITTSSFTSDALLVPKEVVHKTLLLIDGQRLAELMVQYGVGVQAEQTITVKKLDLDFFENI